jgi:hypothetical protein
MRLRFLFPIPIAFFALAPALLVSPVKAVTPLTGTDKLGRHYTITFNGNLDPRMLPPQQDMLDAKFDLAQFILKECIPEQQVTRCDIYAQLGQRNINGPGYLIGTNGPADHGVVYFQFAGIPSGTAYATLSCVTARPAPLSGPDIVEGRGPIILKKDGADLRETYDKRFGCKISLDEKAVHVGGISFTGGK